jgi:nicotinate-nucleotide adenylyltransferase
LSVKSVAIFGGSFDPPHNAHVEIVKEALEVIKPDLLVVFPSYLNPFKKSFNVEPKKRLEWVSKIFEGFSKVEVDSFEIDRGEPTPSYISVEYIKNKFNPKKIYLIIGADNFLSLEKWANYERLKEEVEFVVAKRGSFQLPQGYTVLDIENSVSSTKIRDGEYLDRVPFEIADEVKKKYFKESV